MGLLRRKWLSDNVAIILKEMEYYRDYGRYLKLDKEILWDERNMIMEVKVETSR